MNKKEKLILKELKKVCEDIAKEENISINPITPIGCAINLLFENNRSTIPFWQNLRTVINSSGYAELSGEKTFIFLKKIAKNNSINALTKIYLAASICYHESRHVAQKKFDKYSYESFVNRIDTFLVVYDPKLYRDNHGEFAFEIGANLYASEKTKEYMEKNYSINSTYTEIFAEAEAEGCKYNYLLYDAPGKFDILYKISKKAGQFKYSRISPILGIFIDENKNFKRINQVLNDENYKKVDMRAVYTILSSESFMKNVDIKSLSDEEAKILTDALNYTKGTYTNQMNLQIIQDHIKRYLDRKIDMIDEFINKINEGKQKVKTK